MSVSANASRTELEDLTITASHGFQPFMQTLRNYPNPTDPTLLHMQKLRTLTLRIGQTFPHGFISIWPCLDDAVEILDVASARPLASLNGEFSPLLLAQLSHDKPSISDHPSLRRFEQSIVRFFTDQTTVSLCIVGRRRNRDGFWAPVLARISPCCMNRESGKNQVSSRFVYSEHGIAGCEHI